MKDFLPQITKTLAYVFIFVMSACVLFYKVPQMKIMQDTVHSLEESEKTIAAFTGSTTATAVAISALPEDFATPLADTLSDISSYLVFILVVVFVEKLIVIEGTKIALLWMIPAACVLYILHVWFEKCLFEQFAKKLMILAIAIITVIPASTHFTEYVCADYMEYVDATIAETQAGADKVNEAMTEDGDQTIFEKLSSAFETAVQGVKDLLTYFQNVVKKCVNSIAIMIVTTFVLPLLILMMFRWLLKELFALNLPGTYESMKFLASKTRGISQKVQSVSMEVNECVNEIED